MKEKQMFYPILASIAIFLCALAGLLMLLPNDVTKHANYEYLSFIATVLGGLIGPLISIVGFFYLYLTFRDGRTQQTVASTITFMEKYERMIDEELDRRIYNKKAIGMTGWETTIQKNIEMSNPDNIEISFFHDADYKSETDLLATFIEIKRNLFHLSKFAEKATRLGGDEELSYFFKAKYARLVLHMDDKTRMLGEAYSEYKKRTTIWEELLEIDRKCAEFYKVSG